MARLQELDHALGAEHIESLGRDLAALPTLDRILRRLKSGEALRDADFFEVKRFLYHGVSLLEAAVGLDDLPAGDGPIADKLRDVMGAIHPGGEASARFYLADELDEGLARCRRELQTLRREARDHREEVESQVRRRQGGTFDIQGRFVPQENSAPGDEEYLEFRDGAYWLVEEKLVRLEAREEELLSEVSRLENEVRRWLTEVVGAARGVLVEVARKLTDFDLRLARVRLRRSLGGCWPEEIDDEERDGWLWIEGGRDPHLVESVGIENVQAIDLGLNQAATVVIGPNMGGKSALLRQIGLFQWCAQMALPVGAKKFSFRWVRRVIYVGAEQALEAEVQAGLSSFGREVSRFVEFWEEEGPSFWLLDEPARGTHPEEGARLATRIVAERIARGDRIVVATHFPELAANTEFSPRRIAGLDVDEGTLRQALVSAQKKGEDLQRTLRRFMDYRVRDSAEGEVPRDAWKVARALGLRLD